MTVDEAQERATRVVHEIHEGLEDKNDTVAFEAAIRARLAADPQFRQDCDFCAMTALEASQATRH